MIALLFAVVALALTPAEVPNPRPNGWVSDVADVIPAEDEAAINRRIDAMHADLGVEIAVVTVPSVESGTPKQFTTELFNRWGIGSEDRDDGLLVVLAVEQRRLEMETGYGLEASLPDGWLGVMQTQRMVPRFKEGDFGAGMDAGLVAVEARLRGETLPAPDGLRHAGASPEIVAAAMAGPTLMIIGGTLALVLLVSLFIWWNWKRQRTCPRDQTPMLPLPESEEDVHLTDGQQTEEAIGARRWDVYQCPQCAYTRTFSQRSLFSGYSSCPSCHHVTRKSTSVTEVHATRYSTGRARITEDCAHCSYHNTYTKTLARLPDPATTSSSSSYSSGGGGYSGGGGGFGGGSSGGGGAGSSW